MRRQILSALTIAGTGLFVWSTMAHAALDVNNVKCIGFVSVNKIELIKQRFEERHDVYSAKNPSDLPAGLEMGIAVITNDGISIEIRDQSNGKVAHTWSNNETANIEYGGLRVSCSRI